MYQRSRNISIYIFKKQNKKQNPSLRETVKQTIQIAPDLRLYEEIHAGDCTDLHRLQYEIIMLTPTKSIYHQLKLNLKEE